DMDEFALHQLQLADGLEDIVLGRLAGEPAEAALPQIEDADHRREVAGPGPLQDLGQHLDDLLLVLGQDHLFLRLLDLSGRDKADHLLLVTHAAVTWLMNCASASPPVLPVSISTRRMNSLIS